MLTERHFDNLYSFNSDHCMICFNLPWLPKFWGSGRNFG